MAGLWRIVTAALFAAHLVLGCCAHHSHACEVATHSSADNPADQGTCSHSHGHLAEHGQHGPHDCQGGRCSFVFRGQADVALDPPLQAALVCLPDDQTSSGDFHSEQDAPTSGRLLLPVRLHLANQVLLI
jgi:hypothetical protein